MFLTGMPIGRFWLAIFHNRSDVLRGRSGWCISFQDKGERKGEGEKGVYGIGGENRRIDLRIDREGDEVRVSGEEDWMFLAALR
jgi:hypothetical protein